MTANYRRHLVGVVNEYADNVSALSTTTKTDFFHEYLREHENICETDFASSYMAQNEFCDEKSAR